MPIRLWAAVGALLVCAVVGCGQAAMPSGKATEQDFGTLLRESKWKRNQIEVCWENPSADNASLRELVRRSVDETWAKHSALSFIGWGACTASAPGIHVQIDEAHPHTLKVGRFLDGVTNGMVLNFGFRYWRPTCRLQLEFCVAALAVHEFGHALGFTHEQNRPDRPVECKADMQGIVGDYLVTQFDWHSIMNYCNPQWIGDGKLSELDIESVQKVYGPPQESG